jgi:hypothetical protein
MNDGIPPSNGARTEQSERFERASPRDGGAYRLGIRKDLDESIEGKDVLVVEGICASGLILSDLLRNFQTRNPGLDQGLRLPRQAARATGGGAS